MTKNKSDLHRKVLSKIYKHKRSNAENSDAYKIFSILYGLVVFIGGVAFSISHAIIPTTEAEHIKYAAEIYFTYLYWVSILWITFCIIDIVRHRKKIQINQTTVDKYDLNTIKMSDVGLRVTGAKQKSFSINEQLPKTSSAPYFNLQLFDDSDELQSENHDDDRQQLEKNPTKETLNNNNNINSDFDSDYDKNDSENLFNSPSKSQSLEDLSIKSSVITRRYTDETRDFQSRRHALNPDAVHNLRSYVRNRKDSIVQRVIGYNYDDHSAAGGLYIRVGIGIFCLGTVIHSGLSILSNLENPSCLRPTAVMDDFSRLLFSFIQFFFIFKHSNLIIRAHESLARLSVMHIVVTNLCVWFRMVVIETKSQIIEMNGHEISMAQHIGGRSSINGSQNPIHQSYRPLSSSHNCWQTHDNVQQLTSYINEGYLRLKPLLYPCTIEFSLMCLTLFFLIWENIGRTFSYKISDKASTKNVFMVNCHASIKGLFAGMIVFSCTVISIILYAVYRDKMGNDTHSETDPYHSRIHARGIKSIKTTSSHRHNLLTSSVHTTVSPPLETSKTTLYSIAIVEIANLCLLVISLSATIWALMKIRKLQYKRAITRFDDVLIIVSLTGTYLYSIFSAFALLSNTNKKPWIANLKIIIVVLEFIEATVHAFFILVALRKRLGRTNRHKYPAREIITLLIMLDLSLWFEETTTTTKHEANPFQLAFYHVIPWSIIAAIATPLQIFFRFHASVCLSHVWENMYILPAFESVAAHGL